MTQSGHRAEAPLLDYGQLLALRAEHGEPTDEEVENYLRLPAEMLQSDWDAEVVRVRNWLSRGGGDDPLLKQADTLVHVAEINANSAFTPLLKKFSFLREVDAKHWDFILTIAGVFVAVDQLVNMGLSENRQRKLMGKVGAKLIQRHPSNGRHGFEDCAAFYERSLNAFASEGDDPRFVASDPLGFWVVWNVLGRPPESEEERRLVRTIGGMIHYIFLNWWKGSA